MNSGQGNQWTEEKRLADYLRHHYNLKIIKIKPVRGILRLKTDRGIYALKRVQSREKDRWRMIYELATHLGTRFPIPTPITTQSGQLTFDGFHYKYVLYPWIEAEPIRIKNRKDWFRLTRELANFHQCSKSFTPKTQASRKYIQVGKWYTEWKNAYRQLELFQMAAKWSKQPTETDESWLGIAGYSMSIMENLLRYFEKIKGDQYCQQTVNQGKVCHGNLHRHNFLSDCRQKIYLIDWNQAIIDVRTRDLAQWILYAYGYTGSSEVLKGILQAYQQESPLLEEEFALIYARLLYPERLIRVLRNVYEDQTLPITAGAPSIYSAAKGEEKKLDLMKQYPQLLQEEFHTVIPQIDWLSR